MHPKSLRTLIGAGTLALLVAAASGCGGGSGTEPTPIPNLVGTFTGTWVQELTIDGAPEGTVACPCELIVSSQSGTTFIGRSTLSPPCDRGLLAGQGRGGVLAISNGSIQSSGSLSFSFSEDPRVGLSGGGCTVTAMSPFRGTLSGSTVSAERTESYDCTVADGHLYSLSVRLSATRN